MATQSKRRPSTSKAARAKKSKHQRETIDTAFWLAGILVVATSLLPIILIALIGLFSGTLPSGVENPIMAVGPGYPLFVPPLFLILVPAVIMLVLAVITIPQPLKKFPYAGRWSMSWLSFIGMTCALGNASAYNGAQLMPGLIATGMFFLALVLFILRGVLGTLRLIPQSWRSDPTPPSRGTSTR